MSRPVARRRGNPVRIALVLSGGLWIAADRATTLVACVIPPIRFEITRIDDNIIVNSLEIVHSDGADTLRMRANLRYPAYVRDRQVVPFGWQPHTEGGYQVNLKVLAVLQAPLVLLMLVLSWPQRSLREFLSRLLVTAPLALLLFCIDAPLDLLGNFHEAVIRNVDPAAKDPLFTWARLLEGGGRLALGLCLGGVAITLGSWRIRTE